MRRLTFLIIACLAAVDAPAADIRLQPLKDLNGYFPFQPPANLAEWEVRKESVRRQILVSQGLWPMPTKTPLNAVIHGKIDREGYSIEKVYFESAPGLFVTGNLYRPLKPQGKVPAVMFAHGHWKDARFALSEPAAVRREIATGAERFENGGRSRFQSLCVQLARMGCVVWQWDMLSDSDAIQFSEGIIHRLAKQRPEMNTAENWGLFSAPAESHLQSVMGLQTLNAVRGLDFLLTLPEVDPARVAITGASGGGTQTMLLAAIDDRIKLSFPCVMVSTAMQGGCTCENASLLRINTGNVEFAGLFAPKPQGMNTADDWTKEFATKGFPELQSLYQMYGKKNQLFLLRGEHFPHNYNAVTRSAFYTFLNKHFKLGYPEPVIEQDYEPLSRDQLTVWNADHPAPKAADPEFERQLLKWLTIDSSRQLEAAAAAPEGIAKIIRPAVEIVLGRTFANAGTVKWLPGGEPTRDDIQKTAGTIRNQTHGEEVSVLWLQPKQWNGRVVIWLGDDGKSTVQTNAEVKRLLAAGVAVVGADLFEQGAERIKQTRIVENPREVAAFTHGYNHSLFAQRVHDVLTLVTFLRNPPDNFGPRPQSVCLVGWGETGAVAVAARALAGKAIDRAAIDIGGFRFGTILDYRDPAFLPGGAKYLDLPGLILLNADLPLWQRVDSPEPAVEWLLK